MGTFDTGFFNWSKWAQMTLWDHLPMLYKNSDENGLLEAMLVGLGETMEEFRYKISKLDTLKDPLLVPTSSDANEVHLVLGPVVDSQPVIDQSGLNGWVSALGLFTAPTARFTNDDVGKYLRISGSANPLNNTKVKISSIISGTSVYTYPKLATDAVVPGILSWSVSPSVDPAADYTTVEIQAGDTSNIRLGWTLWDGLSKNEIIGKDRFPVATNNHNVLSQEALDGVVALGNDGRTYLFSKKIVFKTSDKGKPLSIRGSSIVSNNNTLWSVGSLVSSANTPTAFSGYSGISVIDAATSGREAGVTHTYPTVDANPIYFAVLNRPFIYLKKGARPLGILENSGADLSIISYTDGTISIPGMSFDAVKHVGRVIRIWGTYGVFPTTAAQFFEAKILSISDATHATLDRALPLDPGVSLNWEIRSAPTTDTANASDTSDVANMSAVDMYPPSMARLLAQEFGSDISLAERESRQRAWIVNLINWIDKKGTAEAYRIIGILSGYLVQASQLFSVRLSSIYGQMLPPNCFYEQPESVKGRFGTDGVLILTGSTIQFYSPSASFYQIDIGRCVRLRNCANPFNAKRYTISNVLDTHTVQFLASDYVSGVQTFPDTSTSWALVVLLTENPPSVAPYDEVNSDIMTSYVGSTAFSPDMFSWDPNFAPIMHVGNGPTAPVKISNSTFQVTLKDITALDYSSTSGTISIGNTVTQGSASGTVVYGSSSGSGTIWVYTTSSAQFTPGAATFTGGSLTITSTPIYTSASAGVRSGTAAVMGDSPNWTLTDSAGSIFHIISRSTVIAGTPNTYTALIESTSVPVTNSSALWKLTYVCPRLSGTNRDFAPSATMKLNYSSQVAPNNPDITEEAFIDRLAAAKPVHVTFYKSSLGRPLLGGPTTSIGAPKFGVSGLSGIGSNKFGDLIISDTGYIRTLDTNGNVKTVKGITGGAWTPYKSRDPVTDSNGNIFFANLQNVQKLDPFGNLTVFAGSPSTSTDTGYIDGIGTIARFTNIEHMCIDSSDNIYVADTGAWNNSGAWGVPGSLIRKIDKYGNVTTLSGASTAAYAGTGVSGSGNLAQWMHIKGLQWVAGTSTTPEYLLVTDYLDKCISKYTFSTSTATLLLGTHGTGFGYSNLSGVVVGPISKNMYILAGNSGFNSSAIIKITSALVVSIYAGNVSSLGHTDAVGGSALFGSLTGLTVDQDETLYVCGQDSIIRRIAYSPTVGTVTTIAGVYNVAGSNDY
jgi:hypothetical protein